MKVRNVVSFAGARGQTGVAVVDLPARRRLGYDTKEVRRVEGVSFLGLDVKANDWTDLGRVTDVITDRATGEVIRLILERGGVEVEVAVSAVSLEEDGKFATYSPDASDVKPGNHVDDGHEFGGYSPVWVALPAQKDRGRQGQFVHTGDLDEPPPHRLRRHARIGRTSPTSRTPATPRTMLSSTSRPARRPTRTATATTCGRMWRRSWTPPRSTTIPVFG